jgi:hypothetical protein
MNASTTGPAKKDSCKITAKNHHSNGEGESPATMCIATAQPSRDKKRLGSFVYRKREKERERARESQKEIEICTTLPLLSVMTDNRYLSLSLALSQCIWPQFTSSLSLSLSRNAFGPNSHLLSLSFSLSLSLSLP